MGDDMLYVGASDKLDYYLHATTLGAGTEALLGFVEAALSNDQGQEALTFAAACRSASLSLNEGISVSLESHLVNASLSP